MQKTLQIEREEVKALNRPETKSKRKAMRDVQQASFKAIETALYLDTHPYDQEAIAAMKKYCADQAAATAAYEAEYGPISFCACTAKSEDNGRPYFKWALSPMPWETDDC